MVTAPSCSAGWRLSCPLQGHVSTLCPFGLARVPSEQGGVSPAPAQPRAARRGARVCSGEGAARPLRGSPSPSPGRGPVGDAGGRPRPLPCAGPRTLPCWLRPQSPVQCGLPQARSGLPGGGPRLPEGPGPSALVPAPVFHLHPGPAPQGSQPPRRWGVAPQGPDRAPGVHVTRPPRLSILLCYLPPRSRDRRSRPLSSPAAAGSSVPRRGCPRRPPSPS